MILKSQALLPRRTTFDGVDQRESRYGRCATAGLTTTFSTTNISCTANEIAFIDRIVVSTKSIDTGYTLNGALSATNVTSVVVTEANRAFVPVTGTITVLSAAGLYTEIAYTNYATATFTIAATDFSPDNILDATPVIVNGVNITLTLEVNGRSLPFHITSTPFASHSQDFEITPNGNMVLQPGEAIRAMSSVAARQQVTIYYRKYSLTKAYELGLLEGGTMPDVASTAAHTMILATTLSATNEVAVVSTTAIPTWLRATGWIAIERDGGTYRLVAYTSYTASTFTIAATDFSADNAAATNALLGPVMVSGADMGVVNAVTGQAIEILGFYLTGHTYSATADSMALGFWDGVGTFYVVLPSLTQHIRALRLPQKLATVPALALVR